MDANGQSGFAPGWVQALLKPGAYPHEVSDVQLIETHISWVFLTGRFVYKIKKPIDLGFVDFSTLKRRQFFCGEELRLNRRTTPDLYLEVVPIGMSPGGPRIGVEPALDFAVKMRQFDPQQRLDRVLERGGVTPQQMRRAARSIADFHSGLPACNNIQSDQAAAYCAQPALNNFAHLEGDHISEKSRRRLNRIETWTRAQAVALAPAFRKRVELGFIRECHGDLHLANLFLSDGEVLPFDSLEFNEGLRWIDPVSDIAFLVMDLMARDRSGLAWQTLNAWLEACGDYAGLEVLRFYMVYRCMVRLKVASIQVEQLHEDARGEHAIEARHYLGLAESLIIQPPSPLLVLMHGVSGSGKTWTSNGLIGEIPALRVRSDLERKRLHGLAPGARASAEPGSGLYSNDATARTYDRLKRASTAGLKAGYNMIADATFLKQDIRRDFVSMAQSLGARAVILHCEAPPAVLKQRLRDRAARGNDASDANTTVLEHQFQTAEPLSVDEQGITVKTPGLMA